MISADERRQWAAAYGVSEKQIARDHLISHVLRALSEQGSPRATFFGGTALCRTWSEDTRLSEDIDLLVDDHVEASEALPLLVSRGIRREFPTARWIDVGRRHEVDTKLLEVGTELAVKVQFARWRSEWRILPVATTPVRLRYSDLPATVDLEVPTPASIVTMKLLAWSDRQAPRDLFDLHDLPLGGHFGPGVRERFQEIAGYPPETVIDTQRVPSGVEGAWESELGHQLAELPEPATCLGTIRQALARLAGS